MKVCTFFGHSNWPNEIEEELKQLICPITNRVINPSSQKTLILCFLENLRPFTKGMPLNTVINICSTKQTSQ